MTLDADEPPGGATARHHFTGELEQIRLQVDVMAFRVADSVKGARVVLENGDRALADRIVAADDEIDDMLVSLTERCYDLIRRETPVASDLRLIVSVIRILEALERIGDLSLRVVKKADVQPTLAAHPEILATILRMANAAEELFDVALTAWSSQDAQAAEHLAARDEVMDDHYYALTTQLPALTSSDAIHVAMTSVIIGRSLERIADHAVVIGERLGYMLTGDSRYLASEVR